MQRWLKYEETPRQSTGEHDRLHVTCSIGEPPKTTHRRRFSPSFPATQSRLVHTSHVLLARRVSPVVRGTALENNAFLAGLPGETVGWLATRKEQPGLLPVAPSGRFRPSARIYSKDRDGLRVSLHVPAGHEQEHFPVTLGHLILTMPYTKRIEPAKDIGQTVATTSWRKQRRGRIRTQKGSSTQAIKTTSKN